MGNKKSKKSTVYDKIENLLIQTYKKTGIDFTENEVVNFKLRILDAEKYFYTNFDYFIFFNNYLFKEQLSTLYENFNSLIETATHEKPITILIDFDDESEFLLNGSKIEFDSLFTIIFEKLEIPILLFFDMTNVDDYYVTDFFFQIIESIELYKYNRKFDCMYFLMPNTDYFIKNGNGLFYLSNKTGNHLPNYNQDDIFEILNEYTNAIFLNQEIEKFINCSYPKNISNENFESFLYEVKPNYIKSYITFDLNCAFENLENLNQENFNKLKFLFNIGLINCLVIFFNFNLEAYNIELFENTIIKNIKYLFKRIIFLFSICKNEESILGIKFNFKIKNEEEINELNKFSSRTHNYTNNFNNNTSRDCKSARDVKSKKEKEKIFNYFYESPNKNFFEILAFDLTTIINNLINFPQFSKKYKDENKNLRITRQINFEFNELSNVYNNMTEMIKYSSDPRDENGKIVKLDFNLHSERLYLYWEYPHVLSEDFDRYKKRNRSYNNLRNIIEHNPNLNKINHWNILLNIQNMLMEDNIRRNYKIEKSNINFHDYLQKIH